MAYTASSIVDVPEDALVDRLLSDPRWRSFVALPNGIAVASKVFRRVAVSHFARPDTSGDIDVLVVPEGSPECAIAIEVKRVKITFTTSDEFRINKVGELKKGTKQANNLVRLEFCRVYLQVHIVSDSRWFNERTGWSFGGVPIEPELAVRKAIKELPLEDRVGVLVGLFDQPVDKPPFDAGSIGVDMMKEATKADQPEALTEQIRTANLLPYSG